MSVIIIHRRNLIGAALGTAALGALPRANALGIEEMSVEEAREATLRDDIILVDIRTPEEWRETGVADVAVTLDMRRRDFVQKLLALRAEHPERKLGLICATGGRSRYLATWLMRNRVAGIIDIPAGMLTRQGWLKKKLPVRAPGAPVGTR